MLESAPESTAPLETKHRNLLQVEVMRRMLGERMHHDDNRLAWADENGKTISDIVDNPANVDIRSLAREGRYGEAVDEVMQLLN